MLTNCLFTVASTSNSIRDSNGQEVRHDNHVVHRLQHAHDDAGPLPAGRGIQPSPRLSECFIHSNI